jgi:hypothetical protein
MAVPLAKTVDLREQILGYIRSSKVIDDITARRVLSELGKLANYEDRLMLKALLSVAKNDSVSAIHCFNEYIKHYPTVFAYNDYITYLATTAKMSLAYEQSKIAYHKFGRRYGEAILMKMLEVFKHMFDKDMVNAVFNDLIAIEQNLPDAIKADIDSFNENYNRFIELTGSAESEIRHVISIASNVVAAKCDLDVKYQIEQVEFSKNEAEKECGITVYVSNATADTASDMNFELVDLLAANDAFPNGSWALWFQPVESNIA